MIVTGAFGLYLEPTSVLASLCFFFAMYKIFEIPNPKVCLCHHSLTVLFMFITVAHRYSISNGPPWPNLVLDSTDFETFQLCFHLAYFIMDQLDMEYLHPKKNKFMAHHTVCMYSTLPTMMYLEGGFGCSMQVGLAEMGGVFYQIFNTFFRGNFLMHCVFLFAYFLSRIALIVLFFANFQYEAKTPLIHYCGILFCGSISCINLYFIFALSRNFYYDWFSAKKAD